MPRPVILLRRPFFRRGYAPLASVVPVSTNIVSWSQTPSSADWTLSGLNNETALRTSTSSTFWGPIRSATGMSSGSFAVLVAAVGGGAFWTSVGFATGDEANNLGSDSAGHSIGYASNGNIYLSGGVALTVATFTDLDKITVSKDGAYFSFYKNDVLQATVNSADPAYFGGNVPEVGKFSYPSVTNGNGTGTQVTLVDPAVASSTTAYSLTADVGVFTFTGQAANSAISIPSVVGTFSYTGQSITPTLGMPAGLGSFSYTGQTALAARSMPAALGTFSYTGQSVYSAQGMVAIVGTFTYNGQPALATLSAPSAVGTFSYTGQAAILTSARSLAAANGTFTYAGQPASTALGMAADFGSFSYSGQSANFPVARSMTASVGTFTYNGQDATLTNGPILVASFGSFSYVGQSVALRGTFPSDVGVFTYSGQAATLTPYSSAVNYSMSAALGSFTYSGQSVRATLSLASFPPSGTGGSSVKVVATFS